jgi:hypothetical protein
MGWWKYMLLQNINALQMVVLWSNITIQWMTNYENKKFETPRAEK